MGSGPTFAVVIDVYQQGRFVEGAVESVLAQSQPADELVVVDDGSTDDTPERLRRFANQVTVVRQPNGGQAAALRTGFAHTSSEVVVFLDADDTLAPDALEVLRRHWRPELAQIHFPLLLRTEAGADLGLYPGAERLDEGDVWASIATSGRYATVPNSGHAFRRSAIAALFPLDERRFRQGADGPLYSLAPLSGPTLAVPHVLGSYGVHDHNAWWPHVLGIGVEHDRARARMDLGLLRAIVVYLRGRREIGFRAQIARRLDRIRLELAVRLAELGEHRTARGTVIEAIRRLRPCPPAELRAFLRLAAGVFDPRHALSARAALADQDWRDHADWLVLATRPRWPPRLGRGDHSSCARHQPGAWALWSGWRRPDLEAVTSGSTTARLHLWPEDDVARLWLDLEPAGAPTVLELRLGTRLACERELHTRNTVEVALERSDRGNDGRVEIQLDLRAVGSPPSRPGSSAQRPAVTLHRLGAR